jgi:hypothetical protein
MSQIIKRAVGGSGGSGTVTDVIGGNNITITGTPTVNPVVNVSGPPSPTTYTLDGVLYGNTTGPIQVTAAGTTNTVLLGNTGSAPTFGLVPNSALVNNSITFSNAGGLQLNGGNSSTVALGGTLTVGYPYGLTVSSGILKANQGYIVTVGGTTLTMPIDATSNQSDSISVIVDVAGGVTLQASPGQTIRIAGISSTVGGTAINTELGDSVELKYIKTNLTWISQNANGNWLMA